MDFLEWIFKIQLSERTWAKPVTLDTLHWYCEGPKLTMVARRYNSQIHQRKSIA